MVAFVLMLAAAVLLQGCSTMPAPDGDDDTPLDPVPSDPGSSDPLNNEIIMEDKGKQTDEEKSYEDMVKKIQKDSIGHSNPSIGNRVASWTPGGHLNPEELGSYTESDILLPRANVPRNGLFNTSYRWPKGVVVYQVATTFTDAERKMIAAAMDEYHKHTCVRFQPYTGTERDYVSIERDSTGCWSALGRVGGKQTLNLQAPGCLYYLGTVIHELMHVVGFFHEQSRIDRDNFIKIAFKNVITGQEHNFQKYNSTAFGVPYDYGSVMHYSKLAFSRNTKPTIETKLKSAVIGQRVGFSNSDMAKIRLMYKCSGTVSNL